MESKRKLMDPMLPSSDWMADGDVGSSSSGYRRQGSFSYRPCTWSFEWWIPT